MQKQWSANRKLQISSYTAEVANKIYYKFRITERKLRCNEKFSIDDFEITNGNFIYKYQVQRLLPEQSDVELIGQSNNLLFGINFFFHRYYKDLPQIFRQINFDLSEVLDSNGNNILHYAIFRYDLQLIDVIIDKSKVDGILSKLLHHRNLDGTNPLGMAFLSKPDNVAAIKIAKIVVSIPDYRISEYLNNKKYMDYSHVQIIGDTNILHNVILSAGKCTRTSEAKEPLSSFFKTITKRLSDEQFEGGSLFNPNEPTMNPGRLALKLDSSYDQYYEVTGIFGVCFGKN